MARSEFTVPMYDRVFAASRPSLRRRPSTPPMVGLTSSPAFQSAMNPNPGRSRSSTSSTQSPLRRGVSVCRSLFGASNSEDTENMFNFVIDSACDEFRNTYGFDAKVGRPCPESEVKWELVTQEEENQVWVARNITNLPRCGDGSPTSTPVKTLRPIRLDLLNRSPSRRVPATDGDGSDVDMESGDQAQRQRVKEVLSRVSFPDSSSSPSSEAAQGSTGVKSASIVNNNHIVSPLRLGRQTAMTDYVTPLKRKADSITKAASLKFGPANAQVVPGQKRAKISDYFKA